MWFPRVKSKSLVPYYISRYFPLLLKKETNKNLNAWDRIPERLIYYQNKHLLIFTNHTT
jgi:hypothetical protein